MVAARVYPMQTEALARARVLAGDSQRQVSREMGIALSTINKWCKADQGPDALTPSGILKMARMLRLDKGPSLIPTGLDESTPEPTLEPTPAPPPKAPVPRVKDGTWPTSVGNPAWSPKPDPVPDPGQVSDPEWEPGGQGAMRDALEISQGDPAVRWRRLGMWYPPEGMLAEQSALIFLCVATGIPLPVAAQRAGFGAGEPEVWRSKGKESKDWEEWWAALKMAEAWAMGNLCFRVMAGGTGWQGAARQLVAINPSVFVIKDSGLVVQSSSVEGLDTDALKDMVRRQLGVGEETEVADEVMPLSETGMEEDEDGRLLSH